MALDLTGLSGPFDGWSQVQETVSLSPSFHQTHHALVHVPDGGASTF